MRKFDFQKFIDILSEFFLLIIVFTIPLYFARGFMTADLFELNKLVVFKILVCCLLISSLFKLFYIKQRKILKHILSNRYLFFPLLYLVVIILAAVFSINPIVSFQGLYRRYEGVSSFIFYILFFALAWWELSSEPKKQAAKLIRIFWTITAAAFLVSIYGIAQRLGYDFVSWSDPALLTGRATSSLGQPNFLASYLLLIIPIATYFLVKAKKFLIRFFLTLLLLTELLCLFFTLSRGGWLGLIFGIFIAIICFIKFRQPDRTRDFYRKGFFVFLSFCLFVFLILFGVPQFRERLQSSFDLHYGSPSIRLMFWEGALRAISQKSILGYGPDTQGEILSQYYQKNWGLYGFTNDYPDRAHNLILDILLTSGLLGLAVFLAVLVIYFLALIKIIRGQKENFYLALAILVALAAYLFSLLFSFSIITTNVYFWLYLSIIAALITKSEKEEAVMAEKQLSYIQRSLIVFLVLIIGLLSIWQIRENFRLWLADYYFQSLNEARNENDFIGAWETFSLINKTTSYYFYQNQYYLMLAEWDEALDSKLFSVFIKKQLEDFLPSLHHNVFTEIESRAQVLAALSKLDETYIKLADNEFRKLTTLSPEMPRLYREYANFLSGHEQYPEAKSYYQKALLSLADLSDPNLNLEHTLSIKWERSLIYRGLADLYFKQKDYVSAIKYYQLALLDSPQTISLYKKIADVYMAQEDWDQAIWYNKHGMILNPRDYTWPYAIAVAYYQKGDKESALDFAQQALAINSGAQSVNLLLKQLK